MRSGSTLRVGLVGAGFSARLHAEAYHQVRGVDVKLTRVAASRPDRAKRFAEEFDVNAVVASAEEVIGATDVDVVDLCVPTTLHAPLAIKAAQAGKHVIIEKPLTGCFAPPSTPRTEMLRRALADSDEIIAACQKAGVRLCYAENWVYAPPIQRARRLLTAAGGPILRIVGEESHGGTHAPINKRWETGGGGSLIGKGCHPLGAALYLKADEGRRLRGRPVRPRAVMAETAQLTETAVFTAAGEPFLNTVAGADVEDWGTLLLTFDDGTLAQITGGDTTLGGIRNQLAVYAARAVVLCNINPNDAVKAYAPDAAVFGDEYLVEKLETKAGWSTPQPDEDWMSGFPQEIQDFVEAIAHGREPLSGAALARDVVAVIYGEYLSAAEGRRVELGAYLAS